MSQDLKNVFVQLKALKSVSKLFNKKKQPKWGDYSIEKDYGDLVRKLRKSVEKPAVKHTNCVTKYIHRVLSSRFYSVDMLSVDNCEVLRYSDKRHPRKKFSINGLKFVNTLSMINKGYEPVVYNNTPSYPYDIELVEDGEVYSIYKCFLVRWNGSKVYGFVAYTRGEKKFWGFSKSLKQLQLVTKERVFKHILKKI